MKVVVVRRHQALAERRRDFIGLRRRAFVEPIETRRAVIVADDIQNFLIGRDANAVRLAGIGNDAVDRAVDDRCDTRP